MIDDALPPVVHEAVGFRDEFDAGICRRGCILDPDNIHAQQHFETRIVLEFVSNSCCAKESSHGNFTPRRINSSA